jgi:hypothetical protein
MGYCTVRSARPDLTSRDLIKVTLILGAGAKLLRLREYVAARL